MKANKNFRTDLSKIREAMNARKLVILAGAGVSVDSGVPMWGELVEKIKDCMEVELDDQLSEPKIAQQYFDMRGHKEYVEDIRKFLKYGEVRPNQLHKLIFKLKPEHIVTTNFDDLFEQTITMRTEAYSVVKKDTDLPYSQNRNLVIKIHGDLEEGNFVLKTEDYNSFEQTHALQIAHLQALFATRLVLILGYTFRDENLQLVLRKVKKVLGVHHQMAYMFITEKIDGNKRKEFWDLGIKIMSYYDADETIASFGQRSHHRRLVLSSMKSLKGKKVAEFLLLLNEYSPFHEDLTQLELSKQLEKSLLRFSELGYIPSRILLGLQPLTADINTKSKSELIQGSLKIANRRLSDLLINGVKITPRQVELEKTAFPNYNDNEFREIRRQLNYTIGVLYESGVEFIFGLSKGKDSFGYHGWSKDYIELRTFRKHKECNCLICKFQRNEIDSAAELASNYLLTRNPTNSYDIEVGYFFYLIGEFKRSKEIYLNIASSAWEDKRMITFYIALKNLKKLSNLEETFEPKPKKSEQVSDVESHENEDYHHIQLSSLPEFDLDEVLLQINPADEDELNLFKYIRDDKAITDAKRKIEISLKSAKEVYFSYIDNPKRIVHGPVYHLQARVAMWHVFAFYTKNRIVGDIYSEFKSVCELYAETQIVSYCTHSNYDDKLSVFDRFFFIIATNYLNTKHLTSLILRYNLKQVNFEASEQKWVLHAAQNFFQSYYKEYNFFGAIGDSSTNQHIGKIYFSQESRRRFNCMLLLLGKTSMTQKEFGNLFSTMCKFLERERFLQMNSFSDYLPAFLWQQRENIESKHLDKLQVMFLKDEKYIEDEMVFIFKRLHQKLKREPIDDMDLIDRLWPERIDGDFHGRSVYVWRIASKNKRKVLSARLEKFYSQEDKMTNTSLYQFAARKGVIDWNSSFEKYVNSVYKFVSVHKKTDSDKYEGTNPRQEFLLAMRLIYSESIDINDPRLAAFHQLKEEYQKFYLNPEGYDYRKFKTDWLLFLEVPEFFERFKKIPQITKKIEAKLKKDFDPKLAEVYYKHFKQNLKAIE